jgi:hypothetical protein
MLPRVDRLLVVGNPDPVHVGAHLMAAARDLSVSQACCDVRKAHQAPVWRQKVGWWLQGHRPPRLSEFSHNVVRVASDVAATVVVATGVAPITGPDLDALRARGIAVGNFLTDDPWNPAHRAPWFLDALPRYDIVWTPRRANLDALEALRGPRVVWVPFAYQPDAHYPDLGGDSAEDPTYDVLFVGGADSDRAAFMRDLSGAGLRLALYGGYWKDDRRLRPWARGWLDLPGLRRAVPRARINLCLVRRANRDGHTMRSYEAAAMGGCLLVEDTDDHRALFGEDGAAVHYVRNSADAVARARWLLDRPADRTRLRLASRARLLAGAHRYRDRLQQMLDDISGVQDRGPN